MKALVYLAPRHMEMQDLDPPDAGPDDVAIRVTYSGICGSELSGYLGMNSLRKPPLVFGHELSGHIAAIGPRAAWRSAPGSPRTLWSPAAGASSASPAGSSCASGGCCSAPRCQAATPST